MMMMMMIMIMILIIIIIIIIITIIITIMIIIIKQFCETKNACSNVAGCSWILEHQVKTFTSYLKIILNKWQCHFGPIIYSRPFVSKLWHDIGAVSSHVYVQSFLLHDIRALFCHVYLRPFLLCGFFYSQVYDHFLTNGHIYAHKKAHIYALQTSMCICGHRKSWYKRHRIIPSAKNPFMYDGAEK